MFTCRRQNNDPRRHPCPTSLNLGNAVKGMLADVVVGNTETETGRKRVRQMPQEKDSAQHCWHRDGRVHEPGNVGASQG